MITLEMKGLKALEEHLSKMPIELQDKAIRKAGKEVSEAVAAAAKVKAPYDSRRKLGNKVHLKYAIATGMGKKHKTARSMGQATTWIVRSGKRTFQGLLTFLAGLRKEAKVGYGVPVHYGHKTSGGRFIAPVPFMKQAFDQNIQRGLAIFENRLRQEIKKLWPGGSGRIG
jgi:hypothetical protein